MLLETGLESLAKPFILIFNRQFLKQLAVFYFLKFWLKPKITTAIKLNKSTLLIH